MAQIIQGDDLMLFINTSTGSTPVYKSIGFATSHSLEINAETSDVASKDHGIWNTKEIKTFSWTCSSENLMSNDQEGVGYYDLYDLMINKTKIKAVFSPKKTGETAVDGLDVPSGGWSPVADDTTDNTSNGDKSDDRLEGLVIISSLSLNAPNGDNATYTVSFEGASKLEHKK